MKNLTQPIIWKESELQLIDQRLLPHEKTYISVTNLKETHESIKVMVVRGAPCIGFTAIFGMSLWLRESGASLETLRDACDYLKSARPTAVNLEFEIDRCRKLIETAFNDGKTAQEISEIISLFGKEQMENAYKDNFQMAEYFCQELHEIYGPTKLRVLTHCNTGTLACGTLGTALGGITVLNDKNMLEKVWVDETRPYLQGSRLTSFELTEQGIEHDIVVEGAASFLMRNSLVDAIVVGADRIALNGDTANKVGTSNLAIIASHYQIPFYVMAPTSSIDLGIKSGAEIEIELRNQEEITKYKEHQIAPNKATAYNPSFDITEAHLIKGIICEKGLFRGKDGLGALLK